MTQEIKERLEQAAETAWEQDQKTNPSPVNPHAYVYGYKAGAQTILENPSEWGLVHPHSQKLAEEVLATESQLAKYREALERIIQQHDQNIPDSCSLARGLAVIAKEALKQK